LEEPPNIWQEEFFPNRFLNVGHYSSGDLNDLKNPLVKMRNNNYINDSRRHHNAMSEKLVKTRPFEGSRCDEIRSAKYYNQFNIFSPLKFNNPQPYQQENYPRKAGQQLHQFPREARNSTELTAIYLPFQNQLNKTLNEIYNLINQNPFPVNIDHPQPNLAFSEPQMRNQNIYPENLQNNYAGFLILNPLQFTDNIKHKLNEKPERKMEGKNHYDSNLEPSNLKHPESIPSISPKIEKKISQEIDNKDNFKLKRPFPIKGTKSIERFEPSVDLKKLDEETRQKIKNLSETADSFKPYNRSQKNAQKEEIIPMKIDKTNSNSNEKNNKSEKYTSFSLISKIEAKKDIEITKETKTEDAIPKEEIKEEIKDVEEIQEESEDEDSKSNKDEKQFEERRCNSDDINQKKSEMEEEVLEEAKNLADESYDNDDSDDEILIIKDFRYIRRKKGRSIKKQIKKHKRNR